MRIYLFCTVHIFCTTYPSILHNTKDPPPPNHRPPPLHRPRLLRTQAAQAATFGVSYTACTIILSAAHVASICSAYEALRHADPALLEALVGVATRGARCSLWRPLTPTPFLRRTDSSELKTRCSSLFTPAYSSWCVAAEEAAEGGRRRWRRSRYSKGTLRTRWTLRTRGMGS
jgi:hypothetical protein